MRDSERFGGFGGGRGIGSENGEAKNAWVLLPIECVDTEGEGRGECTEDDVDDVSTLRCDERVDELAEDEGLR